MKKLLILLVVLLSFSALRAGSGYAKVIAVNEKNDTILIAYFENFYGDFGGGKYRPKGKDLTNIPDSSNTDLFIDLEQGIFTMKIENDMNNIYGYSIPTSFKADKGYDKIYHFDGYIINDKWKTIWPDKSIENKEKLKFTITYKI